MDMAKLIIEHRNNPHELENLYRNDSKAFKKASYSWGFYSLIF